MKILSFGSLNIDKTYDVKRIVQEGETISSLKHQTFVGGKGLNQSIALARAGFPLYHAGKVGRDGDVLVETLKSERIDTTYVLRSPNSSGHAIIQIDEQGRNSIIVDGGSNTEITRDEIDRVLDNFSESDWCLLQNEISNLDYLISAAKRKKMKVALNLSPITSEALQLNLNEVDLLFVNETEACAITGSSDLSEIEQFFKTQFPDLAVVVTIGEKGSRYLYKESSLEQEAYINPVVDTTAAGDTFTGYFLSHYAQNYDPKYCLKIASVASGISITVKGASNSIPLLDEVLKHIEKWN